MRFTFTVCNVGCKFAEFKGCYPGENSCLFNTNTVAARNTSRANSIVSTIIHRQTHRFLDDFRTTRERGSKAYAKTHPEHDRVSHTVAENRARDRSIFQFCPFTYFPSTRLWIDYASFPLFGHKDPALKALGDLIETEKKCPGRSTTTNAKRPKKISKRISETTDEPLSSSSYAVFTNENARFAPVDRKSKIDFAAVDERK